MSHAFRFNFLIDDVYCLYLLSSLSLATISSVTLAYFCLFIAFCTPSAIILINKTIPSEYVRRTTGKDQALLSLDTTGPFLTGLDKVLKIKKLSSLSKSFLQNNNFVEGMTIISLVFPSKVQHFAKPEQLSSCSECRANNENVSSSTKGPWFNPGSRHFIHTFSAA